MVTAKKIGRIVGITLLWLLSGLLALAMLVVGIPKMMGTAPWPEYFEAWGYAPWFRVSIGALQTVCGVSLLIPPFAFYAAAGLVGIMLGAAFTELTHDGDGFGPLIPLIYVTLLSVILLVRGRAWWQLRSGKDA